MSMVDEKKYFIGEFSKKTGVSIRTLHYYDEKGLLTPVKHPSSGHRLYSDNDIMTLHKIMTLKFLGYRLHAINEMIHEPSFDIRLIDSLRMQQKKLKKDKEQIEIALSTINRTISLLEDEGEVDSNILVSLISSMQTEHAQREWTEQFVEKDIVENLFLASDEEKMDWERAQLHFYKEVKRLAGRPIEDDEVQHLLQMYFSRVLKVLGLEEIHEVIDIFQEVESVEDIDEEALTAYLDELEKLVPTPLTKREEKWLDRAMEYFIENSAAK